MKNDRDAESFKRQFTFGSGALPGEKMSYSLKRKSTTTRPSPIRKNSLLDTEYKSETTEIILNENKTQTGLFLKLWRKLKRNFFLLITIVFMLYVYYVYLFVIFFNNSFI